MLPIAQGSALGKRRPRLIHSAFLRRRKNATRRKRVTHYALNAPRGVAPHNAGCSYRARHFNQCNIVPPGRCPGLSAAIGLTARHTCAANAVKSCIYMNVLLLKNWFIFMHLWRRLGIARSNKFVGLCSRLAQTFLFSSLTNINYRGEGRIKDILYICRIIFDFAMLLAD